MTVTQTKTEHHTVGPDELVGALDDVAAALSSLRLNPSTGPLEGWAEVVSACQRVVNVATAVQDEAIVALCAIETTEDDDGTLTQWHKVPGHVSLDGPAIVSNALDVTAVHAERRVRDAVRLAADGQAGTTTCTGLGALHDAKRTGALDPYRAGVVAFELEEAQSWVDGLLDDQNTRVFCDLDHVRPWPTGPTTDDNLICLCRRHHRIKQRPGWHVTLHPDGTVTWTDPTRRTRTTTPVDALHRTVLPARGSMDAPPTEDLPSAAAQPAQIRKEVFSSLESTSSTSSATRPSDTGPDHAPVTRSSCDRRTTCSSTHRHAPAEHATPGDPPPGTSTNHRSDPTAPRRAPDDRTTRAPDARIRAGTRAGRRA